MVTQKDIAKKLGVSISLVSRVLSGKASEIGIARETIKKIEEECKKLNYVPNSAALNLKGVKTRTLGVIAYDFGDPYLGVILDLLQKIAQDKKYSLILIGSYRREQESMDITPFIKHNIEGLIVVGSDRNKDWYEPLKAKKIPTVQIGFTTDKKGANLHLDEKKAINLAVKHLKTGGHEKLGLLFNNTLSHEIYRSTYLNALEKKQIEVPSEYDICCDSDEKLKNYASQLSMDNDRPSLVVTGDDLLAISFIRALADCGLSVPGDINVLGFDNIPIAADIIPSLTTISPPLDEMIQKAFELATSKKTTRRTIRFAPKLILRESCS